MCLLQKEVNEELGNDSPGTAVLRHIGASWSAVISRIKAHSRVIVWQSNSAPSTPFAVVRRDQAAAVTSHETALSSLVELVGTMCYASGSFMASRIRDEVWPLLAPVLTAQQITSKSNRIEYYRQSATQALVRSTPELLTQGEKLVLAICRSLEKMFTNKDFASSATNLIPLVGTILLPFLSSSSAVGEAVMSTLRSLLKVDCDALWRPLHSLSAKSMPRFDKKPHGSSSSEIGESLLQSRARELLSYADALPEQTI